MVFSSVVFTCLRTRLDARAMEQAVCQQGSGSILTETAGVRAQIARSP